MIDCEKIVEIKNFHSFGLYKSRLWVLRYGYNGMPCRYVLLTDSEEKSILTMITTMKLIKILRCTVGVHI